MPKTRDQKLLWALIDRLFEQDAADPGLWWTKVQGVSELTLVSIVNEVASERR